MLNELETLKSKQIIYSIYDEINLDLEDLFFEAQTINGHVKNVLKSRLDARYSDYTSDLLLALGSSVLSKELFNKRGRMLNLLNLSATLKNY